MADGGFSTRVAFPHPESADADGFLAMGGDLRPGTLLHAYANGIFPWTSHPITWWSPDPRAVIEIDGLHISRSLARLIRKRVFTTSFDRAFRAVMQGCAAPRPRRAETWISPAFLAAYTRLHELGFAHSVECWEGDRLAGGLYGVALGGFFAGESMFSEEPNGSKTAMAGLFERLRARGFLLFDCQLMTPHLASMGAVEIPRAEYLARLREAVHAPVSFGE